MNKRTKKLEKGITLITLVITIIVLLILAGVSIAMLTGDNGILTKSTEAKEKNGQKSAGEQVKIAIMGSYGEDGKINLGELKDNLNKIPGITEVPSGNISEGSFPFNVTVNGQNIEINKIEETVTATAKVLTKPYYVGNQVTVKSTGECFYVLKDSGASEENVTLLAEKNIGVDSKDVDTYLKQIDSAGTVKFSDTNYWESIAGITYPYNLNNVSTDVSTDVINIVKEYGKKQKGTGRLMTSDEVEKLGGDFDNQSTSACPSWINIGTYFLGSAAMGYHVWGVNGISKSLYPYHHYGYNNSYLGVRPVIEISKSLIS